MPYRARMVGAFCSGGVGALAAGRKVKAGIRLYAVVFVRCVLDTI